MTDVTDRGEEARRRRFRAYPEYKDSGVQWLGEIPATWDIAPVYARYEVALGKMLDAKRVTGESSGKYLRNVDVQWDTVNIDGLPEMDFPPSDRNRYLLRRGDLLVCEGGEVGRTAIWGGELEECFYQKAIHRVRPWFVCDVPRFFYFLMYAMAKRGVFTAGGNPNTIDHLTAVQLRRYRVPIPEASDQRAIVAFLDIETAKIDALVARKERLIELLQEKRTALITRAVTRGLDPNVPMKDSGVEWLGGIPVHWQPARLWHLCSSMSGATPTKENPAYWNGDVPWVSPKDMKRRVISTSQDLITLQALEETGIKLITPQVVLVVVRGMILVHSFPVAVTAAPVTINQDMKALRLVDGVDAFYFAWTLDGLARGIIATVVEEAAHGTRAIRMDQWRNLVIPLPPHPEQQAIAAFLDREAARIEALITKVQEAVANLGEFRTALISAAVTGKIDVREAVPR